MQDCAGLLHSRHRVPLASDVSAPTLTFTACSLARSWLREISGTLTSESSARLAGLDGTLDETKITWSNGVKWTRKEAATLLAPPEWKGRWHGKVNNNDVSVWLTSETRVVAEGTRNGKKWKADGHVSGDMIYMFGISGKVRPSSTYYGRTLALPAL